MRVDGTWRRYRKVAPIRAIRATAPGRIDTLEGPVPYRVGDYLCVGSMGERWPQSGSHFEGPGAIFELVAGPDAEGYFLYRKTLAVEAQRQPRAFSTPLRDGTVLAGKMGDWLVREGTSTWVVDADIFARTYEEIR